MLQRTSLLGLLMVGGFVAPSCKDWDSCFGGATWVATGRGKKRIRDMRVGDGVLSFDDQQGRIVESRISRVFVHEPRVVGRLIGTDLHAVTANHPVLDERTGEYLRADELEARGSALLVRSGARLLRRRAAAFEPLGVEPVFNLEVEGTHTYFAEGVVVHNKDPDDGTRADISRPSGGTGGLHHATGGTSAGGETSPGGDTALAGGGGIGGAVD